MDLNEIHIFARVVDAGSFTGAARELGMPKSTVSRKVSELEARLGARLLQRTTRSLSLTDAGRAYYQHAARIVGEIEEAEQAIGRMQDTPRGLLRVTAPLNFDFLGPMVTAFLERYPEVRLDMLCADRVVHLVEEGFDLAVRAGPLADSSLIARQLGSMPSFVVASPAFVARCGRPETPRDLERLECIAFSAGPQRARWILERGSERAAVPVGARFAVNDFELLHAAATGGLGAAMLPVYRCLADLRAGRLERLLPGWSSPAVPIHAVYPSTRHLSPKVRAFLDHLGAAMTPPPWELGPVP